MLGIRFRGPGGIVGVAANLSGFKPVAHNIFNARELNGVVLLVAPVSGSSRAHPPESPHGVRGGAIGLAG
jgi:hypothetical protein